MKLDHYIQFKLDSNNLLVILTDYFRIDDFLPQLEEDLKRQTFTGTIIFDSLLSNGLNSTRFFTANFNGFKVELKTIKTVQNPQVRIQDKSRKFFKNHMDLLNNGVLTNSEIALFLSSI